MIKGLRRSIAALFGGAAVYPATAEEIAREQARVKQLRAGQWTENALRRLDDWQACVTGLCADGVLGTGDAALQLEHIGRIRRDLAFAPPGKPPEVTTLVATLGQVSTAGEKRSWRPGIEHTQPHPVKENPDGTLYYRGWVYRKIGDHGSKGERRPARVGDDVQRRHWHNRDTTARKG